MAKSKRKLVTMTVTVSVPGWLTAGRARKEVRTLIKEQCFWGHANPSYDYDTTGDDFEIDAGNFKLVSVKAGA